MDHTDEVVIFPRDAPVTTLVAVAEEKPTSAKLNVMLLETVCQLIKTIDKSAHRL